MAYTPTNWKDRDVENPRTYTARQNEDGSITFFDAPGTINEAGTPVNAVNMNKIEEQLYKNDLERKTTNCITYIPQDIKLELNNGTLTLKAGSKVYVPNGADKFDEVVISADKSLTYTNNFPCVVWYDKTTNSLRLFPQSLCFSGNTAPTFSGNYAFWYDTANNKCKFTGNAGSSWTENQSLPICIVTVSNGAISSIDQIFNGLGYISNTVYVLPGVKGLIPNGRNADGSLKNTEFTVGNVLTQTNRVANMSNGQLILRRDYIQRAVSRDKWKYYEAENFFVFTTNGDKSWLDLGTYATDSNGVMTLFQPKLPFRAVDYNDVKSLGATITYWE